MRATRIGGSRSSAFRVGTIQSVAMTANIIRCHHSFFIAFSFVFNGNPEPQQKVPRHLQAAIWHRVTVSSRAMKNRTYPEANLKVRDVRIRRVALCMPNGSNRRGILFPWSAVADSSLLLLSKVQRRGGLLPAGKGTIFLR